MKILLLSNKSPWPPKDGGAAATLTTIQGLASSGASVTVLALNTYKHLVRKKNIPAEFTANPEIKLVIHDTGTKLLPFIKNLLFSDKPYTLERFESEEFRKALSAVVKNGYDIIQIEGLSMARYVPIIRQLTDSRIVFRPHNIENQIWTQLAAEEKSLLKRSYFRIIASRTARIESNIIKDFDGLAALTTEDLDWFRTSGLDSRSVVCPAGFPLPETEFKEGKDNELFFIGSLDWLPNINGLKWFLEKVWPYVSISRPEATFHIAGRNPSSRVKEMCSCKAVVFHGEVESSTDFISDKQIMIVPLFTGSGLRIKIIEGMRMGKSIVATPRAVKGTICHDREDIFIGKDAHEFARSIINLLDNRDLRKETALKAKENVRKNYNIFASAEKMMNFYSQLT